MTSDTVILIGRAARDGRATYERHAERLRGRDVAGTVRVLTYDSEPARELRDELTGVDGDRVYAVPMAFAHTYETTEAVPAALSYVPGEVRYCDPPGSSPGATAAIRERAAAAGERGGAVLLVALGDTGGDYGHRAVERHRDRLADEFDEVGAAYLLQSPAVECARYQLRADSAVVVPLFLARTEATEGEIPEKLELDRGGLAYADPLAGAEGVTDAIHSEVERQRALVGGGTDTLGAELLADARPVATDGRGDD